MAKFSHHESPENSYRKLENYVFIAGAGIRKCIAELGLRPIFLKPIRLKACRAQTQNMKKVSNQTRKLLLTPFKPKYFKIFLSHIQLITPCVDMFLCVDTFQPWIGKNTSEMCWHFFGLLKEQCVGTWTVLKHIYQTQFSSYILRDNF